MNGSSSGSTTTSSSSPSCDNQQQQQHQEFNSTVDRSKFNSIKTKYENLIQVSKIYTQSFSNLNSLTTVIDEFMIDLNKIEMFLNEKQLTPTEKDIPIVNKEVEIMNNLKVLFKLHESDIKIMKDFADNLRSSMKSVRSRQLTTTDVNTKLDDDQLRRTEERQTEDLKKLDFLIEQLNERWWNSKNQYKNR
jgi:hypothetical protein